MAFLLLLLAVAAGFDTWLALAPTGPHTNRRRLQRLQPKRSYWCGPAPRRWRRARCLSLGVGAAALVAVAAVVAAEALILAALAAGTVLVTWGWCCCAGRGVGGCCCCGVWYCCGPSGVGTTTSTSIRGHRHRRCCRRHVGWRWHWLLLLLLCGIVAFAGTNNLCFFSLEKKRSNVQDSATTVASKIIVLDTYPYAGGG